MARSRRGSRGRMAPRQRRPRADWVYRGNARNIGTNAFADALGSYEGNILTINAGPATAQARVLYDSTNYTGIIGRGGTSVTGIAGTTPALSRAARAEGRKPTILAVEGFVYMEATAWALGSLIAAGFRLGVFEQDQSGVLSLDANYSMWRDETVNPWTTVSAYANNGRSNTREWRRHHFFTNDTSSAFVQPIRWRGRRTLQGNECFALYVELESTSANARTQFWLRSLVVDEG